MTSLIGPVTQRRRQLLSKRARRSSLELESAVHREHLRFYVLHSLLLLPAVRMGLREVDAVEALDASLECRHGRLAGDRTPPCGCWSEPPA